MQPSVYLQSADYALFGLPKETTIAQVIKASGQIDGYLQRPEGLIYDPELLVMDTTDEPIMEMCLVPLSASVVLSRKPCVQVISMLFWNGYAWAAPMSLDGASLSPDGLYRVPFGTQLYTNCMFNYVAGWPSYAQLPFPIKQACASVIQAYVDNCDMSGNIKSQKAGDAEIERFKDTVFDSDTKSLLGPFRRVGF